MFHLFPLLPWLVVVLRFLMPLQWLPVAKVVIALVLLISSQQLLINRLSSGSVFSPEYPRPLIILLNLLFGFTVLVAVFQIAADLLILVMRLVSHDPVISPILLRYSVGTLAFALAVYGVGQAIRVPPLKEIEVKIADLPKGFEGYRILQLTDLHISRLFPARWAEAVVRQSNDLKTDLTVITGDFIDGGTEARRADIAPLAGLRATDGVYAIPGNHEYIFDYDAWMKHDAGLGIRMLLNEHVTIEREGDTLVLAGLTDLAARNTTFPRPDLARALQGAPEAPVILLEHQPGMAKRSAKSGVALQLSGHTHGGMVIGLDRLVARANDGFVSGMYQVGNMKLYVNNGTALWPGFAIRLGRPSELTVFTLRGE
ncbi:metallophosphoesterase [Oryzifoliimicrobium ureilyticus]|uniref:metallophosphoesterase n=1 Tax=Oryzifoliimicrobium ureilyticus TaxID=3113724 RepID=UPI00307684DD